MPVVVEARRDDKDPFFGSTEGWYVECYNKRFQPGEEFEFREGKLVFEEDGYQTEFCYHFEHGEENQLKRAWISCADSKTFVQIQFVRSDQPVQLLADSGAKIKEIEQQNKFVLTRLNSSFKQEQSPFRKAILKVHIGEAFFFAKDWDLRNEEKDLLSLTVSFKDKDPEHICAQSRSEIVSPSIEFDTYSQDLGVSLLRIDDSYSRVIHLDPDGMGFQEGVRIGDLLVSSETSSTRRWSRMEIRRVVFNSSVEFDYDELLDEDDQFDEEPVKRTIKQSLTFTLRLTPSPDSALYDYNLEPLEYLFGSEPAIESNGIGNSQYSFAVDPVGMGIHDVELIAMNYLKLVELKISLENERIYPADVCSFRLVLQGSLNFALISTSPEGRHTDLSLMSLKQIQVKNELFADGSLFVDASMKWFQVDDQRPDASFPVAISPTPLAEFSSDAPAFRTVVSIRSNDTNLLSLTYFELFLTETSLKLHESFLLNLAEFSSALSSTLVQQQPRLDADAKDEEEGSLKSFDSREHIMGKGEEEKKDYDKNSESTSSIMRQSSTVATTGTTSTNQKRVFIEHADLKPMRFNITFASAASSSEKRVKVLLRQIPLVSALISAIASVSDAPLRLGAVRLDKESNTASAVALSLARHYSSEVMRGLLAIAGSTDILGSPVHLIGSFSTGAFSFFYEPALALSLGYGHIGEGLQKGGSELISKAAGGVFDSFSKMTKAVSKAVAQVTGDQRFAQNLDMQLKAGSFNEPLNFREGLASGVVILLKCILDSIVGLYPTRRTTTRLKAPAVATKSNNKQKSFWLKLLHPVLSLLLKPSAGFFASLNQVSVGIRNALSYGPSEFTYPSRLPRPRETKVAPYSAARSAGYLLARHRFGITVNYVFNEICQIEVTVSESTNFTMVSTIVVTDSWIVACRETLLDVWAIPLDLIDEVKAKERHVTFLALGRWYTLSARSPLDIIALQRALDFASKARTQQLKPGESFLDVAPRRRMAPLLEDSSTQKSSRRVKLRNVGSQSKEVIIGGSELDVAGCRIGAAEMQSAGYWPDGVYRYRIKLIAVDSRVEWIVERRYKEFLKFRDQACKFLSVSRRSMPLPGRRPWILTVSEQEERWKGLQAMLITSLKIDLLAESEVLREFLTRGADHVQIREFT